jgi:transposase
MEVDLLYFDTTSTYFQIEDEDDFRKKGHSKDHRPDLPQVIIGLAVTRDGIPVRCWSWPGNTSDMSVLEEVRRDLRNWKLGRVITVLDRGFASEENMKELQRAGGHYIIGEKMRNGKAEVVEAIKRPGRYHEVRENLRTKEIVVGDGEARSRYVLVHNPAEAKRQKAQRDETIAKLRKRLAQIRELPRNQHTRAICELVSHRTYGRYLRDRKAGRPKINMAKVREEERYDGKYLLKTSDDTISAEDVALGYKQLMDVERAFRTLKSQLDLRPVYHRLEDRIRAHVILCWLALLLVRIIESATGDSWENVRTEMSRMVLVDFSSKDSSFQQRADTTDRQAAILSALKLREPPLVYDVQTPRNTP